MITQRGNRLLAAPTIRHSWRLNTSQQQRHYNFASQSYASCFGNSMPKTNVTELRQLAIRYLEHKFEDKLWYREPVVTLVQGCKLRNGDLHTTVDAFGRVNGQILFANPSEVKKLIHHLTTYQSPYVDLREKLAHIEEELLTTHVAFLIGNQAMDFAKQDGVTEIEESIQANVVERRMNDLLISDEFAGKIKINRNVAIVGCVSNFSNFLDLFRKTIRNLSLGVPCLVLSRSNTTQHMYRWTELLVQLLQKYNIDPGMLTFASCNLEDIKTIIASIPESPMYITCSRSLAKSIKTNHPNTISSTGGPNTLVATYLTPQVSEAIRVSATIENSGQCTALRLAVLPNATEDDVVRILDDTVTTSSALECLKSNQFATLFDFAPKDGAVGYVKHPRQNSYYRLNEGLPEDDIDEHWRRVVIDVATNLDVDQLAAWLVRNQPISLAINSNDVAVARELFEKTALVVYTVGTEEKPALTCQARPQEAEVFGEFPPRRQMDDYTKYPVIVPSATPSYNSVYNTDYLKTLDVSHLSCDLKYATNLLHHVKSKTVLGYCIELANYLADAVGPKERFGSRTVLWGLQRPPLNGQLTLLRCDPKASMDDLLPWLIPFYVTNARDQIQVSVGSDALVKALKSCSSTKGLNVIFEDESSYVSRVKISSSSFYNIVVSRKIDVFPMVGNFVSRLLLQGHLKSTSSNDHEFISNFRESPKWLRLDTDLN